MRARTLLGTHDVALDAVTALDRQVADLDGRCLQAVTVDGGDHVIPLADIDEVDHDLRRDGGEVLVRHSGGELRIPMPPGAELADRLSAAVTR